MASLMWSERIPPTADNNTLYLAVAIPGSIAMTYLAAGMISYKRFLRGQAVLAATGDAQAHEHLDPVVRNQALPRTPLTTPTHVTADLQRKTTPALDRRTTPRNPPTSKNTY
ncbi:hypothetical protein [Streptomyces sp. NPDC054901]